MTTSCHNGLIYPEVFKFDTVQMQQQQLASLLSALPVMTRRFRLIASTTAAIILFFILIQITYYHDVAIPDPLRSIVFKDKHPNQGANRGAESASGIDWSKFAYVQYVTDSDYLCNSVMLFEILHRLGSRPDRLMMYPSNMMSKNPSVDDSEDARLLVKARDEYNVHLRPIEVQHRSGSDPTWADSFTKLLAFNQTDYNRVLSLDSDATILQSMDELFLLPPSPVAMPRAHWLYPEKQILSSQIMLVQPSIIEFERVVKETTRASNDDYDMEIVNKLYKDQALVLPHRPYDMLTAEFRTDQHAQYLGSDDEKWDPLAVLGEAKFLHFSDWPVPKPWIRMSDSIRNEKQPSCRQNPDGGESCLERDLWNGFYADFAQRREVGIIDKYIGL
ncbi:N-acetylglucosaminyltransferase [Claviceps maximensis]|nr:N-acetylglucosaminyltransferase [Claviceps maximensis]